MKQQHPHHIDGSQRRTAVRALRRALGALVVTAVTAVIVLAITDTPGVGQEITTAGAPTTSPTLPASPKHTPTFLENFDTPAAAGGQFSSTYANSWQPYAEGTSGKYFSGQLISAHDGVMDVAMDGKHGAAGVFGAPDTAWGRTGGTFSIRARAVGGDHNGVSIMLWPTSNIRSDGEINYPEGNFEAHPMVFHHLMVPGHEGSALPYNTGVSFRDWHTYTTVWKPGTSVSYYLDGTLIDTVTTDVPTTPHRYTFQIGNAGEPGHVLIDWVSIDNTPADASTPPAASAG